MDTNLTYFNENNIIEDVSVINSTIVGLAMIISSIFSILLNIFVIKVFFFYNI